MKMKSFFNPEKAVYGHFVAKVDVVGDSSLLMIGLVALSYFVTVELGVSS